MSPPQPQPPSIAVDRFEGDRGEWAVLVLDDGRSFALPRELLPGGAKEGDSLRMAIEVDPAATEALARRARSIRDDLRKTDPGGDIAL